MVHVMVALSSYTLQTLCFDTKINFLSSLLKTLSEIYDQRVASGGHFCFVYKQTPQWCKVGTRLILAQDMVEYQNQ